MQDKIIHSAIPSYTLVSQPEDEEDIFLMEGIVVHLSPDWEFTGDCTALNHYGYMPKHVVATAMHAMIVSGFIGKSVSTVKKEIRNCLDKILFDAVAEGLIKRKEAGEKTK